MSTMSEAAAVIGVVQEDSVHSHCSEHEQHQQWAQSGTKMAACNATQKVLEEKERQLVERIQANYGKIKEVERELASLQLQLRVNVGPKKHALEMLRRKIETQNEKVKAATARRDVTKKAFDEAAEALAAEERVKEQLCQELNMLVQQSAHSQLEKLDQLTRRLELLNAGINIAEEAEAASRMASGGQPGPAAHTIAAAVQQDADALRSQILAAASNGVAPAHHQQHQQQNGAAAATLDPATNPFLAPPAHPAPGGAAQPDPTQEQRQREEEEATRQRRLEQQERQRRQAEAEAARARHVPIGRGGAGRGGAGRQQQQQQQQQQARPVAVADGPFRGFD